MTKNVRRLVDMHPFDLVWFLDHFDIDGSAVISFKADISEGKAVVECHLRDSAGRPMIDSKGDVLTREYWVRFTNKADIIVAPSDYKPENLPGSAETLNKMMKEGWTYKSVVEFLKTGDINVLVHTGKTPPDSVTTRPVRDSMQESIQYRD